MIAVHVAIAVFALGVYGVLAKRDILRIFIGATLMLSGVTILAVAFGSPEIVLFAWAVEVVEVILALALFLYLARKGITDIGSLREFRW